MLLVVLAALCVAAFTITFKFFARHSVPLKAAIAINYAVAFLCGLITDPPADLSDLQVLWWPGFIVGILFVAVFILVGISAQRAGAARTTIAGRMSLVLTVGANTIIFKEHPDTLTYVGVALSLAGLVLSAQSDAHGGYKGSWLLLLSIFIGSGIADICVSAFQRTYTTTLNEGAFRTLCFGAASIASLCFLLMQKEQRDLLITRTWVGGAVLGVINFASLTLLIAALGRGELAAGSIFCLMNIGAIIFSTAAAMLLFQEKLSTRQWCGIALCVAALVIIMRPW